MSRTPRDVILLYEEHAKRSAACNTSLQRDSLRLGAPLVQWEVEVLDVREAIGGDEFFDFVLQARFRLHDPWRWWRGNRYSGEMSLTAYLKGKDLRERLLTMKRGARVRVEGHVTYHARHFGMNPAKLLA
jgi:hypothetical protein